MYQVAAGMSGCSKDHDRWSQVTLWLTLAGVYEGRLACKVDELIHKNIILIILLNSIHGPPGHF